MSDSVDSAAISGSPDSMGLAAKEGQSGTVVRSTVMRRLIKNPLGIASIVILGSIALLAIFAPVLAPFEENFANIAKTLAAPDSVNILGTDSAGRDNWSRLLFGAQLTLLSALLCAGVAIAIGLPAGLIAGYYGGKFEGVSNWVVSILMSLPGLIVLLTIRAAFGPSVWISMIAFGVLISPSYFRLTRTAVQSEVGRALRRRREGFGPFGLEHHRPPHFLRGPGTHHHPDRGNCRCCHRHPVRPGVPGPR